MPCTQIQFTFGYGDIEADACQATFGMGRHVVRTFEDMVVIRLVFFDETVVYFSHVSTHVRVGVLVDGERTTRVFDK